MRVPRFRSDSGALVIVNVPTADDYQTNASYALFFDTTVTRSATRYAE